MKKEEMNKAVYHNPHIMMLHPSLYTRYVLVICIILLLIIFTTGLGILGNYSMEQYNTLMHLYYLGNIIHSLSPPLIQLLV